MAGIYIHIPFCRKACHYCDFHFSTQTNTMNDMVAAICRELDQQKTFLDKAIISTIYFGGGTPSLLPMKALQQIVTSIRSNFSITKDAEISFEVNPDDIHQLQLENWLAAGINRLSIGVQSFQQADLDWMNRAHTAQQSLQSIDWVSQAGFTNFSIDLIYGSVTLTNDQWKENLALVDAKNIPHLSAYALTVEPKTALAKQIQQDKIADVNPEKQAKHFTILSNWASKNGYTHYEISNLAKPGFYSKHNTNYWKGVPYLGIGPSAHSFNGKKRSWNISNNAMYIQGIKNDLPIYEEEVLTDVQRVNEYIMTALRTIEGINLDKIRSQLGEDSVNRILRSAQKAIHGKLISKEADILTLTEEGKFLADGIAADLFL
jgi:oxygen-independent coproporphyrinogen III oxidase